MRIVNGGSHSLRQWMPGLALLPIFVVATSWVAAQDLGAPTPINDGLSAQKPLTPTPASEGLAAQKPLSPPVLSSPVRLESNPVQSFPAKNQPTPPMSIGPAPGLYPAPIYSIDGRPLYLGSRVVLPAPAVVLAPPAPVPGPYPLSAPSPFLPANPSPAPVGADYRAQDYRALYAPGEVQQPVQPSNFRLSISEAFLNRIIARSEVQPGPVRDNILGAEVSGRQTTFSRLHMDLLPSSTGAHGRFVLNGDVQTLTTGVTPQAMIGTAGQQQFVGVKDVFYDGTKFSTRHATVYIRANNQTIGAMTPFTGTLIGGIADRIAFRAAERQKSAGEAVARDRLAEKVFPTFDGEVDGQLAKANRQLDATVRRELESRKLMPSSQQVWTTDTQFHHAVYIGAEDDRSSIGQPTNLIQSETGATLSIHESLLNTLMDKSGVKGFTITDKQIRDLEAPFLVEPFQEPAPARNNGNSSFSLPSLPLGTEKIVTDIVFDEEDPLKFRIEDDRLIVTMKATFKPGGQSIVPPMIITIPYQLRVAGDKLLLTSSKPRVVSQDRPDPDGPPTIVETTIEKLVEAELVPLQFDRKLPAALWTASGPAPQIAVIKSEKGWVHIGIE